MLEKKQIKTVQIIAKGKLNGIQVTVGATNFDFIGGSNGAAETEAIIYGVQHAIDNQNPIYFMALWWWTKNV